MSLARRRLALTADGKQGEQHAGNAAQPLRLQDAKVAFFGALFAARTDVYAIRFDNRRTGKSGWIPAVRGGWQKGARHEDRNYLPRTPQVLAGHLKGEVHIGLYPLLDGDRCWWLAADFDGDALLHLQHPGSPAGPPTPVLRRPALADSVLSHGACGFYERVHGTLRLLLVVMRRGSVPVASASLHSQQRLEVPCRAVVRLLQQCDSVVMVLALGVLAEPGAADHVRCCDARVDKQRHVCVSDVVYLVSQVGYILSRLRELPGFPQPPRAYLGSAGASPRHGSHPSA
jgi:hypothetical protein